MKPFFIVFVLALTASYGISAEGPPDWAYGVQTPAVKPPSEPKPNPDTALHLQGSPLTFTLAQVSARFGPADWFPGDHPQMPE
ncbi:MAG TPA: hypothetical protein VKH18_02930, partial [Terriglobales bacterium]|nr:hypothetical protein [Terriglobales bacterium]